MKDLDKIKKAVKEELQKGTSRAQTFQNVALKFKYAKIDPQTIEHWFQFIQGHQKYSPDGALDDDSKKLVRIILEESQRRSKITEWTEPKLCALKLMDDRYALGVKNYKHKVLSLVRFDSLNGSQKEIPVEFEISTFENNEDSTVFLECIDGALFFIVVVLASPRWLPHRRMWGLRDFLRSFIYLISVDFDRSQVALISNTSYSFTYRRTIFHPRLRRHFGLVCDCRYYGLSVYPGRVDDTGFGFDGGIPPDRFSFAHRIGDTIQYLYSGVDGKYSLREIPIIEGSRRPEVKILYEIEADEGSFDWDLLNAPYKWSGSTCFIAKQLKSDVEQFLICRFDEKTKKLEKTGIQLVGKCVDLFVEDGNLLTICVKSEHNYSVHKFEIGQLKSLFNLSLLAVRRHSNFYTNKQREQLMEKLPEKLQTFRFD